MEYRSDHKRYQHEIQWHKKTLYSETDGSGIGIAGLLQVREGMSCAYDETPNNPVLRT